MDGEDGLPIALCPWYAAGEKMVRQKKSPEVLPPGIGVLGLFFVLCCGAAVAAALSGVAANAGGAAFFGFVYIPGGQGHQGENHSQQKDIHRGHF